MLETQQAWIRTLVLALDLCGTFVFALSGAAVGIRHKLDLFGVRGGDRGRHYTRRATRRDSAGGNPRLAVSGRLRPRGAGHVLGVPDP